MDPYLNNWSFFQWDYLLFSKTIIDITNKSIIIRGFFFIGNFNRIQ